MEEKGGVMDVERKAKMCCRLALYGREPGRRAEGEARSTG